MTKNKLIAILGIVIIIVVLILYKSIKKTDNQQATPVKQLFIKDIVPGTTTKKDVIEGFGNPVASKEGTLQYKSRSPARNNEIKLQNDTVSFVKEIVSYGDIISFKNETSQYKDIKFLYGQDSVNGYFLYYIPEKGLAYLANPNNDTVLEIWHFPQTTSENFINTWAKGYSETPPKGQF